MVTCFTNMRFVTWNKICNNVSMCEFGAFKTLDCYTIHYQNCNTHEVVVAVYKNNVFCNLEYNIEKEPADLIILQSKGLKLADIFHCVGLRHTGKYIRRFGGIYAYCRYFIDRKW